MNKPIRRVSLVRENMNTQNTQQYHEFIQDFFYLFDKIKNENDPIYNARAGFHIAKFLIKDSKNFLIKHRNWNWDERVNKACEVIFRKCNKTERANQELQEEAKGILNEYIYENGVEEVSIYGNHANIELKDSKKEFEISEFLNSDFCQENGISGFSTLHSDGQSGMHGFVAEEGKEKRKVRHYVVTDGSYEMTLNWHDKNGKKCTIKVKIDKDGVDLIERSGVTLEQLKANTDVKIGGLFLHQIQFRQRGQEQENRQSSEIVERNLHNNRTPSVYNSRSESNLYNNGVPPVHNFRSESNLYNNRTSPIYNPFESEYSPYSNRTPPIRNSQSESNLHNNEVPPAHNFRSESNLHNNRTPPPKPPRTIPKASEQTFANHSGGQRDKQSLVNSLAFTESAVQDQNEREKDKRPTFTTFGYTASESQKLDRNEQGNSMFGNQQQSGTQQQDGNIGSNSFQGVRNFEGNNSWNVDVEREKDKRPTFTTFGYTVSGNRNVNGQQPKRTPPPPPLRTSSLPPKEKGQVFVDNSDEQRNKQNLTNSPTFTKSVIQNQDDREKDKRPTFTTFGYTVSGSKKNERENSIPGSQEQEENSRKALLQDIRDFKESNLRYTDADNRVEISKENNPWKKLKDELPYSPFPDMHEHNSDNKGASDAEWEESEQSFFVTPKNKSSSTPIRDKFHEQSKESLDDIESKGIRQEAELPKDSSIDIKTNDSGYSSPTCTNHHEFQIDHKQLKASLMNVKQDDLTEFTSKLNKETQKFPLKPVNQKGMSEQTKERLLEAGLLKDSSIDVKIATEQENADTNLAIDKNSELYKLLEKDEAQLKAGVVEEEKETEYTCTPDRNRVALGNKGIRIQKSFAEQEEEKRFAAKNEQKMRG